VRRGVVKLRVAACCDIWLYRSIDMGSTNQLASARIMKEKIPNRDGTEMAYRW
jgi:hypothetical protein